MICVCKPEGLSEANTRMLETYDKLAAAGFPTSAEDFLSMIAHALNIEFEASIEGIGADMWFGLTVAVGYPANRFVYVECDRVEDGLASIYLHLKNNDISK